MEGVLLQPGQTIARRQRLTGSFALVTTADELKVIESNRDPFVHIKASAEPGSVWSRTIVPGLVVAGAAVVLALFFLVRG
jgi:hypothetical protein